MPSLTIHMGTVLPGFYMAPDGNDSADGSFGAPRRNFLAASALLSPGDTLWARGGTYTDPGGYNWTAGISGTSGAPITVKAYPGETPVFDGTLRSRANGGPEQGLILNGVDYITVEDLAFTRYRPYDNGVILLSGCDNVTLRRIHSYGHLWQGASPTCHHVYISGTGAHDLLVDACNLDGFYGGVAGDGIPGAAVQIHDAGGQSNVTVQGCTLAGNGYGVQPGYTTSLVVSGNAISDSTIAAMHFYAANSGTSMSGNTINGGPVGIFTESLATYGPATEDYDDFVSCAMPFKEGWPGSEMTLAAWQATGRGAHDTVT